jgi:hypothetical protein
MVERLLLGRDYCPVVVDISGEIEVRCRVCVLVVVVVSGNCGAVHVVECLSTFALLFIADLSTCSDTLSMSGLLIGCHARRTS